MRRAARVDDNQEEIVNGLRAFGATVHIIGRPVDLLVGYRKLTVLMEVKDPSQPASNRELTPLQQKFFRNWVGGPAVKVETLTEALAAIGIKVEEAP